MVVVKGKESGFDVQFDFRLINLSALIGSADSIEVVDHAGETRAGLALGDIVELRYNQPGGGSSQLWFNVDGLQQDSNGNLIGGTITDVLDLTGNAAGTLTTNYTMSGLNFSAADMRAAAMTMQNQADDRALFEADFAGADRIELAGGNDLFSAGGGNDLIQGNGGNDTLIGGSGRDRVEGGRGHDRLSGDAGNDRLSGHTGSDHLSGGSGHDTLTGGDGSDRLIGGTGADWLIAGRGDDRISGGSGADGFVFNSGDGQDIVTDFAADQDKIKITTGAEDFSDLRLTQQGANTVLRFADFTVTLIGVTARELDAADFLFA